MGDLFEKCWITTQGTPPLWIIKPYCAKGSRSMEGKTQLVTFKRNYVKLAWAFINLMNAIYHLKILPNLSKDNIMLHFLPNRLDVVYIGVCNWGEVGHL
jgi:hypothetical protein